MLKLAIASSVVYGLALAVWGLTGSAEGLAAGLAGVGSFAVIFGFASHINLDDGTGSRFAAMGFIALIVAAGLALITFKIMGTTHPQAGAFLLAIALVVSMVVGMLASEGEMREIGALSGLPFFSFLVVGFTVVRAFIYWVRTDLPHHVGR